MRFFALGTFLVAACGASTPPPAPVAEPEPAAAPSAPAPQPEPESANQALYEATAELAEAVGALAESAGTDCEGFADSLDQLMVSRAEWIEEMKQRAEAVKASGEPMPPPGPEMQRRLESAMVPVKAITETCSGNTRFEEAMSGAFRKVSD